MSHGTSLYSVNPKFHYADFHRNFPARKVMDTNQESRGHKPSWHVKMFATKSMTSPRQTRLCHSNGIWPVTMHGESRKESPKVRDKFADLLPTQIMKVGDVICVTVFHDLSTNLSRTLSQSRRHGIWALSASCGIFVCFNYLCVSSIVLSVSFATMFFIGE